MNEERLITILRGPHISEKATLIADKHRQFVFKVASNATKTDIKKATELMFNVKVDSVSVVNVKGKQKMFRHKPGSRKGWKKAYVTLQEGHDIEFAGGAVNNAEER